MPKCKCGSEVVCIDNHYICERYFEHIKKKVEEQQEVIEGYESIVGGEDEEI